jgi:hypothetical protein
MWSSNDHTLPVPGIRQGPLYLDCVERSLVILLIQRERVGNSLAYGMAHQALYRSEEDSSRGLDALIAFEWGPDGVNRENSAGSLTADELCWSEAESKSTPTACADKIDHLLELE